MNFVGSEMRAEIVECFFKSEHGNGYAVVYKTFFHLSGFVFEHRMPWEFKRNTVKQEGMKVVRFRGVEESAE